MEKNKKAEELRSLNRQSHKISKPNNNNRSRQQQQQPEDQQPAEEPDVAAAPHQPPVYNINKNDFRDVVQKLTGSPAHHPSKPVTSSRLHRIRPPPLSQVSTLPAPLAMNNGPAAMSPLPPFPSVHAAAESPISAYLRFFPSPLAFGCHPSPLFSPPPPVSPVPSPGKNE